MSVRVFAPAKINLTLEVGKPRANGRHPLQSFVMFADVGDYVAAHGADTVSLEIAGPFASRLSASADNLVLRAAKALQGLGAARGARLTLEKHVPIASGIGGGSSDAAATLKALNALWELNWSEARLQQIGAALGGDVPACVAARSGWMSGTGEVFESSVAPFLHAVLVNVGAPVSTGEVYQRFDAMGLGRDGFAPRPALQSGEDLIEFARSIGNDLETAALSLAPEIAAGRDALLAHADHVALSGSGGTWFGLFESGEAAQHAARLMSGAQRDWWVVAAKLGAALNTAPSPWRGEGWG